MKMVTCRNRHSYDADMFSFCPTCAAAANIPAAVIRSKQPSSVTLPPDNYDDVSTTAPAPASFVPPTPPTGWGPVSSNTIEPDEIAATAPVSVTNIPTPPGGWGPIPTSTVPETDHLDDFDVTKPVGVHFTPVVGWLVCIEGIDKGMDYRIRAGYNYIGRSPSMDICILHDDAISRDKNAVIIFDDMTDEYFFAHQNGSHPVRLNGKMVAFPTQIHSYDILTIGRSKFLFIPLCGERFSWNEEK